MPAGTDMAKLLMFLSLVMLQGRGMLFGDMTATAGSLSDCVNELILPIDGILARGAGGSSGPIAALLYIGEGGKLTSLKFEGGKELFQRQIEQAVRSSKFAPKCAGKILTLVFSFEIEGEPLDNPSVWFSFSSPNHFTLHTHPRATEVLRTKKPK
jgi:hypothetical protein